ncbi:hypothetical protein HMPREF1989_01891 [Porphyromonas gingivalis F0566]|nr:hypothetical protein HMPREF1989_01891 [Porphyromonas gingivalis F0566]
MHHGYGCTFDPLDKSAIERQIYRCRCNRCHCKRAQYHPNEWIVRNKVRMDQATGGALR